MNLELLNTVASLATAAIIGATAVAAMFQLRHLRSNNQINAQLAIRAMLNEKSLYDAAQLLRNDYFRVAADPAFRRYIAVLARGEATKHESEHTAIYSAAVALLSTADAVGELVKRGVIDEDTFLASYHSRLRVTWRQIESFIAMVREATGDEDLWCSYEYLVVKSIEWSKRNPSAYPKGVRRMHPNNPWAQEDRKNGPAGL
jgi:hypothetical protein